MRTGRIVQDDDATADRDQAAADCILYAELADMVEGNEGPEVFLDLMASMQAPEDYEVYETTVVALHRFEPPIVGACLFEGWWGLRERSLFRAWDLLNLLARGGFGDESLRVFNATWGSAEPARRADLLSLVREEEVSGWLNDETARGRLRPQA